MDDQKTGRRHRVTRAKTAPPPIASAEDQLPAEPLDDKIERVVANVRGQVATSLRRWASRRGLGISEAMRRLILIGEWMDNETDRGNRIAVISDDGRVIREVQFL